MRFPARRGTTPWPVRILAALLLAPVLVLLLAEAGLAILLPDQAHLKNRIAALVERDTGRALSITGRVSVSPSWHPTISLSGVLLANLPGGSRADMARAERISFTIALLPLLHRRVVVEELALIGPNILFEQVGGRPNWVFHRDDAPDRPDQPAGSSGFSLRFRTVSVRNGMTTFRFPPRTRVVGIRSLVLDHPRDGGPLHLRSTLVYRDFQPFELDAGADPVPPGPTASSPATSGPATSGPDTPWHAHLFLSALGATARATGTASLSGRYALQAEIDAPALERVNALLPEMDLPPLHDVSLSYGLRNGAEPGDLPIPGPGRLRIGSADLSLLLPGLHVDDVTLASEGAGTTATGHGHATWKKRGLRFDTTLRLPARLDDLTRSPLTLAARLDGASADTAAFAGTLALRDFSTFAGLDGTVHAAIAAASAFRDLVSVLPPLTGVSLDGRIVLAADHAELRFTDARLSSAQGDLSGTGRVALRAGPPSATAQLRSDRLDLDALLPPSAKPATPLLSDDPLPFSRLRGPDLSLDWRAAHLSWHAQDWPDLHLRLTLRNAALLLDLPDGSLRGRLSTNAAAPAPPVSLFLDTPSFPLSPLAGLLALPGPVDGTLALSARLDARGASTRALLATLSGPVSVSATGAAVSNAALTQLAGPALKLLGSRLPPDGRTPIRCFGVSGTLTDGIARLPTIALASSPLTISGDGTVDLVHDTLSMKLHPLATLLGSRVSVPVVLDGSFSAPRARLDAGGLDKIGIAIDALFGGDHPRTCARAGLASAAPNR